MFSYPSALQTVQIQAGSVTQFSHRFQQLRCNLFNVSQDNAWH